MIVGELSPEISSDCNSVLGILQILFGMNQEEFAAHLGVKPPTIYRWEHGQRQLKLSIRQILIIEKKLTELGLTFNELPENWTVSISSEELRSCLSHIREKINQTKKTKSQTHQEIHLIS